ncbi:hypothetical protein EDB19DRAFT_1920136 [Suillus lakei]|nr:hypothetical protein EDB19DRAFT_1920136 [Suillus lakei]
MTGPDVAVPTSWQGSGASLIPSRLMGPIGYSAHHGAYSTECQRWAKLAYAAPGGAMAETISLKISAVHEAGARKKARGILIGNICEGKKDIDAQIDTPSLINLAMETVLPKLLVFGGTFSWRNHEFICLQPTRKGPAKALVFKTKQFSLMVVVPEAQWTEFEDWQEANEMAIERTSHHAKGKGKADPLFADSGESYTYSADPPFNSAYPLFDSEHSSRHAKGKGKADPLFADLGESHTYPADPLFNSESAPNISSTAATVPAPVTATGIVIKWTHERAISSTSNTISPPRKYIAPCNPPPALLCSPNHNDLKIALKIGGGADLDMKQVSKFQTENIHFYSIPTQQLNDLLKCTRYHAFSVDNADSSVYVTVDMSPEGRIGIGGFKTAHAGWLTLMSPPMSGLGSTARHDVVVKHPFYKVYPKGAPASLDYKIGHFALMDKLPKLFREANVLYWAKALLGLVYDVIDRAVAGASEPVPFDIPHMHFVEAGLALSCYQDSSKPASKAVSACAGFLLEEVIDGGDEDFVKYIHNMDPNLLLDPDEFGYDFALFLVFTQHVQYVKTGGLVFISDYQGNTKLLTDPQIMTHPLVSDNKDIFGGGNIEKVVSEFETCHICNHFCKWAGFELQEFGSKVA